MPLAKARTVSAVAAVDLASELIARDLLNLQELGAISDTLATFYYNHQQGLSIIESRVTESDFLSLWQLASSQTQVPSLGFEIGQKVNVDAKGVLANWISCCETLKESFSVFQDNISLLNASECWSVSYEAEYVLFSFEFTSLSPSPSTSASHQSYPAMAIERSMVAFLAWGEFFSGRKFSIETASFVFDEPSYRPLYESMFGSKLSFSSNKNCIKLTARQLDVPINSANLYLRDLIAERSQGLDLDVLASTSVKAKVKYLLKSDLLKYSSIDALLAVLPMSRTTLYRKLKEEQAVFSELVLKERLSRLAMIESSTASREELAETLGFNDVSSYYKFIKRMESSAAQ